MRLRWAVPLAFALCASTTIPGLATGNDTSGGGSSAPALRPGVPNFSHVFVVIEENHDLAEVLASPQGPTFNALAAEGAVAANYFALSHPSEPNYIGLIGGDTFGVDTDSTATRIDAPTIVDQLEAGQHSWKAYMEGLPAPGSLVPSTRGPSVYAKKHDPFVLFTTVLSNSQRLQQVVPLSQLQADLDAGQAPDFSFIVPDMCHDMHDCRIATGDAFLAQLAASIRGSSAWDGRAAMFITFDEAEGAASGAGCCDMRVGGGQVGMIALSPLAKPSYVSQQAYNHYSLLRTVEDAWQLGPLGHSADPGVQPLSDLFLPS